LSAVGGAGNESAPAFGPDFGLPHQFGDGVATDAFAVDEQRPVHPRTAIELLILLVSDTDLFQQFLLAPGPR
jgi:hypothetical protein